MATLAPQWPLAVKRFELDNASVQRVAAAAASERAASSPLTMRRKSLANTNLYNEAQRQNPSLSRRASLPDLVSSFVAPSSIRRSFSSDIINQGIIQDGSTCRQTFRLNDQLTITADLKLHVNFVAPQGYNNGLNNNAGLVPRVLPAGQFQCHNNVMVYDSARKTQTEVETHVLRLLVVSKEIFNLVELKRKSMDVWPDGHFGTGFLQRTNQELASRYGVTISIPREYVRVARRDLLPKDLRDFTWLVLQVPDSHAEALTHELEDMGTRIAQKYRNDARRAALAAALVQRPLPNGTIERPKQTVYAQTSAMLKPIARPIPLRPNSHRR